MKKFFRLKTDRGFSYGTKIVGRRNIFDIGANSKRDRFRFTSFQGVCCWTRLISRFDRRYRSRCRLICCISISFIGFAIETFRWRLTIIGFGWTLKMQNKMKISDRLIGYIVKGSNENKQRTKTTCWTINAKLIYIEYSERMCLTDDESFRIIRLFLFPSFVFILFFLRLIVYRKSPCPSGFSSVSVYLFVKHIKYLLLILKLNGYTIEFHLLVVDPFRIDYLR